MKLTLLKTITVSLLVNLVTNLSAVATPQVQEIVDEKRVVEDCTTIQVLTCDLNKPLKYGIQDNSLFVSIQYPYAVPTDMESLYTLRLLGTIDGVDYILDEFSFGEVFGTTDPYSLVLNLTEYTTISQSIPLWIEMVSNNKDFAHSVVPLHAIDYEVNTNTLAPIANTTNSEVVKSSVPEPDSNSLLDIVTTLLYLVLFGLLAWLVYMFFFGVEPQSTQIIPKLKPAKELEPITVEYEELVEPEVTTILPPLQVHYRISKDKYVTYNSTTITGFLDWILTEWQLTIGNYFDQMIQGESFFLIAATGLGKTVGTPIYLLTQLYAQFTTELIQQQELYGTTLSTDCRLSTYTAPRVFVVVPTIVIAVESSNALNTAYHKYLSTTGVSQTDAAQQVLYGCRTSKVKQDYHAPIQFITTGILPLYVERGEFRPGLDSVLIDEAHNTIPRDEAMELAISSLWQRGVTVSYMSATVGTDELATRLQTTIINAVEERFPKFIHSSDKPLTETVLETIQNFFVARDERSSMFPPTWYEHRDAVLIGTKAQDRASGILVVVDSFNGLASDAVNLREAILPLCTTHGIEVLGFAGSVRDDDEKNKVHEDQFDYVKTHHKQYVIITTNVIEMGINWATLDVVITKPTEIINAMINGHQVTLKVPISTAAIMQRIGRVGRKRPGIGIITTEQEEENQLTDQELNTVGLPMEQITFPLTKVEPYKLAYKLVRQNIVTKPELQEYLLTHRTPSIVKREELDYVLDMTMPLIELHQKLGVNDPKYQTGIDILSQFVGDPMYPWLLTGWKLMQDELEGKNRKDTDYNHAYQVFTFFVWLGINSQTTAKRYVKPTHSNFDKGKIQFSDLLTICNKNTPFSRRFNAKELVRIKNAASWEDFDDDNPALRAKIMNKLMIQFTKQMYDVVKQARRHKYHKVNPEFFLYFEEGEFELPEYGTWFTSIGHPTYQMLSRYNTYRGELEDLYRILGIGFKFKSDLGSNQWTIEYYYQGDLVTETVDTTYHFITPNTTDRFYGLLVPSTSRDQTTAQLTMEHWYNMDSIKGNNVYKS